MHKERLLTLSLMILAVAIARLLPHEPNFTPVAAIALFAGAQFSQKWLAFAVPAAALLISDLIIGFYPGMAVNYLAFAAVVYVGFWLRTRPQKFLTVLGASVAGAVVFFVISNFSTWLSSGMYPMTAEGLSEAFAAGIPFFRNTLISDLIYTAILFGGLYVAERKFPSLSERPATA